MPAKCKVCGERHTVCFSPCNKKPTRYAEAVLTVRVVYDLQGAGHEAIAARLEDMMQRAVGEGALTGGLDSEVMEWDQKVTWRTPA